MNAEGLKNETVSQSYPEQTPEKKASLYSAFSHLAMALLCRYHFHAIYYHVIDYRNYLPIQTAD
jgi:hypothetical protein